MRDDQFQKLGSQFHRSIFIIALLLVQLSAAAFAQSEPAQLFSAPKWRLIGPFRRGRVVAVADVPGDSTAFYFGRGQWWQRRNSVDSDF